MAVRGSVNTLNICLACGAKNARDAGSCAGCGEPLPAERAVQPLEFCTIALWRGYRSTSFYAAGEDGVALLESQPFRFKGNGVPPDAPASRETHSRLLAALEADGWVPDGAESEPWFATRLVRPSEAPAFVAPEPPPRVPEMPAAPPKQFVAPPPPAAPTNQPAPEVSFKPAAVKPEPLKPAPEPRRRRRPSLIAVTFCAGVALTTYGLVGGGADYGAHQKKVLRAIGPATMPKVVWTGASAPAKPKQQKHPMAAQIHSAQAAVRVSITAKQVSWLEIRDRSATGRVLYSGELAPGRQLHFEGTRLWGRLGSAGNLTITQNGRSVALLGTFEHVFSAQ